MTAFARRAWSRIARRIGYTGIAGLAALAAVLVLAACLPALRRQAVDAAAAAQRQAAAQRARPPARAIAASPADGARAYVDGFPALSQNAADMRTLFAAAQSRHLPLPKGEYQLKATPNGPFVTYTATFPIRADFDTTQAFCADVLGALPHAALDELRLSRDSAGSTALDAVVRFTFFYRNL
ncbi:MAG: hypothetical protein ACTHL8_05250 [Burkholderiaceae bacterium]